MSHVCLPDHDRSSGQMILIRMATVYYFCNLEGQEYCNAPDPISVAIPAVAFEHVADYMYVCGSYSVRYCRKEYIDIMKKPHGYACGFVVAARRDVCCPAFSPSLAMRVSSLCILSVYFVETVTVSCEHHDLSR